VTGRQKCKVQHEELQRQRADVDKTFFAHCKFSDRDTGSSARDRVAQLLYAFSGERHNESDHQEPACVPNDECYPARPRPTSINGEGHTDRANEYGRDARRDFDVTAGRRTTPPKGPRNKSEPAAPTAGMNA
jgi:hypothetical protein